MTDEEKIEYINEHRAALDRPPFEELTSDEIAHHMDLIRKNAPFGIDPWTK